MGIGDAREQAFTLTLVRGLRVLPGLLVAVLGGVHPTLTFRREGGVVEASSGDGAMTVAGDVVTGVPRPNLASLGGDRWDGLCGGEFATAGVQLPGRHPKVLALRQEHERRYERESVWRTVR